MKSIRNEHIILWLMGASTLPFLFLYSDLLQKDSTTFWPSFIMLSANILGFIASLCFFWQIIIGTRHFTKYITTNTVWVNKLHRVLGTYGIIFILAHPLLEAYTYLKSATWLFDFSFSTEADFHISLGRIALILFLIIWITSAIVRKKLKFHPWKYIHYLAYPLMGFVFIHALEIGTFLQTTPWVKAIWIAMLLTYLILVVLRLSIGGGLWKNSYSLISIEHVGDSIIILRLKPKNNSISSPRIGQYAYLQINRFHEAHPFTVMDFDEKTNELTFGIRMIGPFTRLLASLPVNTKLFIDGPYGTFTQEGQNSTNRIIIAGGIGVTPFVRLAKAHGKGMTFIHCNRTKNDIVYRDILKASAERYIDVLDESSELQIEDALIGRLDLEKIKKIIGETLITQPLFFLCGSPFFVRIMKEILRNAGVPKNHLHSEELGFL